MYTYQTITIFTFHRYEKDFHGTIILNRHGELVLFSGGMQRASYGDRHTITVMTKDKHVVFDFTSKVIDFFTVFARDEDGKEIPDNPEALIVLAEEEIVAIDLTNPQWKMMALPYLVSLHASAVNIFIYIINFL